MRVIQLLILIGLQLLVLGTPAHGQVRGMYAPGATLSGGGTVPDPGFSISDQYWINTAGELHGPHGRALPIQGTNTVSSNTITFGYVPRAVPLGAHIDFAVGLATTNNSFVLIDPLPGGSNQAGAGRGLTNTYVAPLILGWHFDRLDVQTGYGIYVPTGRYLAGASNNTSSGFWTQQWQTGATIRFMKTMEISIFNAYLWNSPQLDTGVRAGQNDSIDYSLSRTFSFRHGGWPLQVGLAGYSQWQVTRNRGQNPIRESLKYRVDAAGFTFTLATPFKGVFVAGSALWEYGATNTYQGRTMTIGTGFAL